ncbi:MAG: GAF domain-containing protein [Rubrivivax sp.]|nr:GAF domain-containing protein [Rubrivivax sp.]
MQAVAANGWAGPSILVAMADMTTAVTELAENDPRRAAEILGELASDLVAVDGDLPALLERFLEPLLRMSGAQAGAVRAITDLGDQMQLIGSLGLTEAVAKAESCVRSGCGTCGAAASGSIPVWTSAMSACAQVNRSSLVEGEYRRMLAVPLQHRGRVHGIYNLFFSHGDEPAPEVLALLRSAGELLGLALNNARLERAHLRLAVMNERRSMAAEVHDSVAQTLAFIKMRMPLLQEVIADHDEATALRYAGEVRRAVTEAHASVRELLTHFRAPVDPLGLRHALQSSIAEFEQTTGIELAFSDRAPTVTLSPAHEVQLSRIVQEALTNIARHAGARHTWVTIDGGADTVEILVEDDGYGLPGADEGEREPHYGIDIMRQRAASLGGLIEIGRREGGGTRVRVRVPRGAQMGATS